ncbi:hypothetical protein PHAVU_006G017700 [Phaseolus vulgaris]|uniref:RING-type domain-containing protein n=1 Tax=Phaseolus vulgaris TaxID=3885 RepID=V7BJM5_PHAVU|nr:hypothetical protein PHAVU_006G017700g [Phaseolus vulgaris]ESW18157.1 hypothetical protein PHAVU_006G017700g [Phaseolus vulgaris]
MPSRRSHYSLNRVNNQHTTVAPGDTFILHSQVLYFPIRPGWLEHQFPPRPISSQDFFQDGQNFLCSTLSHSRFVIDSLEEMSQRIVHSVRQMFQVGSISDFLSLEPQHRVIPLSLSVVILDNGMHAAREDSRQTFQSSRRNQRQRSRRNQNQRQPSRRNQRQNSRVNHMSEEAIINTFLKKCTVMRESEDCCICLEELNINAECYTMPCQHVFHLPCILTWLKTSSVCPLCRYSLPTTSQN